MEDRFQPEHVRQFSVSRHAFTTAAILTLQAPERERNPYDLRVHRARWHSLVHNCSVRSSTGYGIGQRLDEVSFPEGVPHVDIRGEPGVSSRGE